MRFKVTPAIGKDIYPISDPHNTWGGPIAGPGADGKYHAYIPLYKNGSLWGAKDIKHGTADNITGPYLWNTLPEIPSSINPGFLAFKNESSGRMVYSLWDSSAVKVSDSLDGPFSKVEGFSYPSGPNAAPVWHGGAFYMTNQRTGEVWTTSALAAGQSWTLVANISHSGLKTNTHAEDPFMWIDKRNNWHIINHAYDLTQSEQCGSSVVSDHFFSKDGKDWHAIGGVEPYGHTVHFDDGTSHTYSTLERPYIYFDATNQMTHISFAADLTVGDEGCKDRSTGFCAAHKIKPCCCNCCKFEDHAGTIVVALDV
jgi:hypothetical protein